MNITLEVITPEKLALKEDVDFVVLPAVKGEMGVLPGHTPVLAQLSAGELRITKGGSVKHFAVSGGFAEVHPDRVEVFAETAELAEEIDVERARLAASKAKEQVSKTISPEEMAKAQAAMIRALVRLRVSEGLKRALKKTH